MGRIFLISVLVLLCTSCGGGIDSYEDGVEAQGEILEEMVSVLESVTDENSANEAADEIEALGNRLAEVAERIRKLPPPWREIMQERARQQGEESREFQSKAASQMMKLAEYPVLNDAWTRAMEDMK